jgi:glutathionylspermidine synthase
MRREAIAPRRHWRSRVEALGFEFHTLEGPYWVDDACYRFSAPEIDAVERAVDDLHAMCLDLVANVVRTGDYEPLGLDGRAATLVERSWRAGETALYGRMDLAYDGHGPVKLLEYNADTPTALFEAGVVQWYWLEDTRAGPDQFNLIHEALVAAWRTAFPEDGQVHFAGCLDVVEDRVTLDYLRDTCAQAGLQTQRLDISEIGFDGRVFTDLSDNAIARCFKLYPWEWMLAESFAEHLPTSDTRWIEPAWKMILSNKSLLPMLWERHPGHPNLLAASHDPRRIAGPTVAKPRFGREGEGIHMSDRGFHFAEPETVYQERTRLFQSEHGHALLGAWVVGDAAAGLGIREDDSPITGNTARFVPHCFD